MHIEILVEDSSGKALLEILLQKILGNQGDKHTWRIHGYLGVGKLPSDLGNSADAKKRLLLTKLPKLLNGYGKTPGYENLLIVLDSDRNDCKAWLGELRAVAQICTAPRNTLFRLAIEEVEAWYLGDRSALNEAYPKVKERVLGNYRQDSVCETWELLADAIHPGGRKALEQKGWPEAGLVKNEWARKIGPKLDPDRNVSPSFMKLVTGLRRMVE